MTNHKPTCPTCKTGYQVTLNNCKKDNNGYYIKCSDCFTKIYVKKEERK